MLTIIIVSLLDATIISLLQLLRSTTVESFENGPYIDFGMFKALDNTKS